MSSSSRKSVPQQNSAPAEKKPTTQEEAYMRRIALYFVIGFCTFSEIASLVAFFLTRNMEAIIFQIPAMLFFYRILCYLYPGSEANAHPLVALIQTLWRHKL